jgi:hypothetical protein
MRALLVLLLLNACAHQYELPKWIEKNDEPRGGVIEYQTIRGGRNHPSLDKAIRGMIHSHCPGPYKLTTYETDRYAIERVEFKCLPNPVAK